jgi:amidase
MIFIVAPSQLVNNDLSMSHRPSSAELQEIARSNHFVISDDELPLFQELIDNALRSIERLDYLASSIKETELPGRDRGHFPTKEENPFGAWAWKCSIKERDQGPLAGKKIAIKDNVCVGGIPLVNGSEILKDFVPNEDATIVRRILEAGGEIVGKARCENLCTSGGSHTSYPEPVKNPRNPEFMTGGSSSGSAALLVTKEVDMSIGGDQAGSIRIPASWTGVYGLKATFGLIPYTGILSLETSIDHIGPMANSVYDVGLLLETLAGRDGLDNRQLNTPAILPKYSENLKEANARDLKIGIVKEGFDWPGLSESDTDSSVRNAAEKFSQIGATVREISIPYHREGINIWIGIDMEGAWSTFVRDNGLEHTGSGYYNSHLIESWARSRKSESDKFPYRVKMLTLVGNYLGRKYDGRYYTLAQNLRRVLRTSYDSVFQEYDLLLMPTTPRKAQRFPQDTNRIPTNTVNTCPFNVTGHPAMNVPCGISERLPIGMMLIGKHFDETTLLRAAYAYE